MTEANKNKHTQSADWATKEVDINATKESFGQTKYQPVSSDMQPPNRGFIIKEIIIGFLVTIACNLAGMYFYISAVSDVGIIEFLKLSIQHHFFTSVVGLGAIMDFLAFFVFLKKRQYYRVRGVLFGVILAAVVVGFFLIRNI